MMDRHPPIGVNRLLGFRSLDRLYRLDQRDRVQLFEEIFARAPSEHVWEAIIELFVLWPENEGREHFLRLAEERLAGWDDRLRAAWSSAGFLSAGERLSPLARLVRSIEIYRREERGSSELLAIAGSEHVSKLTSLTITQSEISSRAWQAMIASPYLADLQHLHVRRTALSAEDIRRLFQSASFVRLQDLKLSCVGLNPQWMDVSQEAFIFADLQILDLSDNVLADKGALLLASAPWLRRIQRLNLRDNFIPPAAMRALLESPFASRLEQVDLSGNPAPDADRADLLKITQEKGIALTI